MNRIRFALLEPLEVRIDEPVDRFDFVRPRWRFLLPWLRRWLKAQGAHLPFIRVEHRDVPCPYDLSTVDGLSDAMIDFQRVHGHPPAAILVGRDEHRRITWDVHANHPSLSWSWMTCVTTRARSDRWQPWDPPLETIFDVPVVVNPWMEGVTLLPSGIPEAIAEAKAHAGEERSRYG